jgi:hypothetical protein
VSRRRAALVVLALLATFDAGGAFAARYRPSAEERARIA